MGRLVNSAGHGMANRVKNINISHAKPSPTGFDCGLGRRDDLG